MIETTLSGFTYLKRGIALIRQPRYRWFVLAPVLINSLLFLALAVWLWFSFDGWITALLAWLPAWDWLQWLRGLFWLLYALLLGVLFLYGFSTLANIIASPFFGLLAERIQAEHQQQPLPDDNWAALLRSIPASIGRELHKLAYFAPRLLLLLLLGFIPVLNAIAPLLWVAFSAWSTALQYLDIAADNNRQSFPATRRQFARQRWQTMSFGLPVWLLMFVPFVNVVTMPAAVAGATLFWCDQARPPIKRPA